MYLSSLQSLQCYAYPFSSIFTVYMKVSIVLKFCVIKVVISDKNTNKADNVRYASVDDCKTKLP